MITTRELARLLMATALAAALAGCSGTTDEPGPQPTGSAAPNAVGSGAEESPTNVVDATDPRVDEPPADEITLAYTVPAPRTRETGLGRELLGPVFTEDLVLFTDDRDGLHAVDRESGQEQWQVKRRMTRKDGDTPCALTLPTPDAEVVVVNHGAGDLCGDFTVYSLADGSVTETYDSVSREGRSLGFDLPATQSWSPSAAAPTSSTPTTACCASRPTAPPAPSAARPSSSTPTPNGTRAVSTSCRAAMS
jgi:hypothetical protein